MEAKERTYTLVVKNQRISVTEEVYKAYYQLKERERYLDKLSQKHHLSFEECEALGIPIGYILSQSKESMEDNIIKADMLSRMVAALETLSEQERRLIYELFFCGKSERQLSAHTGISQKTINDRKHTILRKLKKLIDK